MMPLKKKTLTLAILVVLLVSALAIAISVDLAQANPGLIVSGVPRVQLLSPQSTLYYENTITLSFYGNPIYWGTLEYSKFKYWLDGELKGTLDAALKATEAFSVDLTGVKDGQHTVEVTAIVTVKSLNELTGGVKASVLWAPSIETSSGKLNFTIDTTAPNISIISLQNRTFEKVNVPLNFTVSEPASEISYSLDENKNVTFTDNVIVAYIYGKDNYYFVLNGLEEGSHSLKIYAKDAAGYTGESETYYFTVNTQPTQTPTPSTNPSPSPTPSPTIQPTLEPTQTATPTSDDNQTLDLTPIIALTGVVVVAVAVGALVYSKGRKP